MIATVEDKAKELAKAQKAVFRAAKKYGYDSKQFHMAMAKVTQLMGG